MRPLLVLLERLWGSLGASLTALGASLGVLGRVLGTLRELLETSSAQETLYFREFGPDIPPKTSYGRNLYYQGTGSETMRERLFARK